MSLPTPILRTALAAGLTFAGGWLTAWQLTINRGSAPKSEQTAIHRVGASTLAPDQASGKPEEGRQREEFLALLREGVGRFDHRQLHDWARSAAVDELQSVITALGASPEPRFEIQLLVSILASRNPAAAVQCFEAWSSFGRFQLIRSLVSGWAREDPKAALSWLATQPPNAATDGAREAALVRLAAAEPAEALAMFRANGWQWDSPQAMRGLFRLWAQQDPKAALDEWRQINRELNPDVSGQGTPPLPPFTTSLIGQMLEQADATRNPQAVTGILDALEQTERDQIDAIFWFRWLLRRDMATYLPMLEQRISLEKMREIIQLSGSLMLDRAGEIAAALKNPELRLAVPYPHPPPAPPPMPGELNSKTTPRGTPADTGGDFWSEPLKLDP